MCFRVESGFEKISSSDLTLDPQYNTYATLLTRMAPMAVPSSNGVPLGVPISSHEYDLTDADSFNKKGLYSVGANPPPAWSQRK